MKRFLYYLSFIPVIILVIIFGQLVYSQFFLAQNAPDYFATSLFSSISYIVGYGILVCINAIILLYSLYQLFKGTALKKLYIVQVVLTLASTLPITLLSKFLTASFNENRSLLVCIVLMVLMILPTILLVINSKKLLEARPQSQVI